MQLVPVERLTSAPDGFDSSEILTGSAPPSPGIAEHAERAAPPNNNRTRLIEIPHVHFTDRSLQLRPSLSRSRATVQRSTRIRKIRSDRRPYLWASCRPAAFSGAVEGLSNPVFSSPANGQLRQRDWGLNLTRKVLLDIVRSRFEHDRVVQRQGTRALLRDMMGAGSVCRIRSGLPTLDDASRPEDMNLPGFRFHALTGRDKGRYAVNASGNWRITFGWTEHDATDVDLEDYH